jgi:hypothetical protein
MSGETKDVSHGGAFILCREPLKPNEVLEVSISVLKIYLVEWASGLPILMGPTKS